ncbi:MAG: formate dehydrogenase subunit alpha, partial [Polyangia bacterium]
MRLTVNGSVIEARRGALLLETLEAHGIVVPHLCYDPRIASNSSCRLCEVEIAGRSHPACACATAVEDGMVVATHTPALEELRCTTLGLLAQHYPRDAVEQYPDKDLHRWLRAYGMVDAARGASRPEAVDAAHPYIRVDMSRCIDCYRCVRICEELQGQFTWKVWERGDHTRVVPDSGTTLLASSCVSCGACVDSCPSGALEDVSLLAGRLPERWVRTTCPYCGTGCEMNVGVRDDRIVDVRPVLDAPVSKGHLCVKGRYATGFVDAPDRVLAPQLRQGGGWVEASWEQALDEAARALVRVRDTFGADAIGVLGSARGTNEEAYLTQKLARLALGTNNVDCCARVCHAPSAAGLVEIFGTGAATNCFDDIERAALLVVVGANATENHPIVGARIRQRALAGVPLVVIDSRRTELARIATVHLAPRPGTNVPLFNALCHVLIDERLVDHAFIERRTDGFEAFAMSVREWTPERAAPLCGVDAAQIRQAARLYGSTRPGMCFHGLGVTEQIQGTDGVLLLADLALLTGNIGVPGAGVNPLRGQNNVQGCATMGCDPAKLTGSQKLATGRAAHEREWGGPLPARPGLTLPEMLEAADAGRLKALVVVGYDILLTMPNADATLRALGKLDALIVLDLFETETSRAAGTVFLPVASSFEKDGTFMNSERRIQRVRQAIARRGGCKSDGEVLCLLAERLGHGDRFRYADAGAVWDEIRRVWPAAAGISYERIESGGLMWPCPSEAHPGSEILHADRFPVGPRAHFAPVEFHASAEQPSAEYPFVLVTGRQLHHFNAATMTDRTHNRELCAKDLVQLHPDDAARLGVGEREPIRVRSRYGSFMGRASLTRDVRPGELFATFHEIAARINRATGVGC